MELEISLNQQKSIFKILRESIFLYFKNFLPFTVVMIYPIVAHIIGIPYIIYVGNGVSNIFPLETRESNALQILLLTILATIPGFLLILSGFWAYLIAMVSLNRFAVAKIDKDQSISYASCAEFVKNRKNNYVTILTIFMIIWVVGFVMPLFPKILDFILPQIITTILSLLSYVFSAIILTVTSIYLSLAFQVFAFEERSAIEVLKKSFDMIKSNFWRTFLLIIVLSIITGLVLPLVIYLLLDIIGVVNILSLAFIWLAKAILFSFKQLDVMFPGSPFSSFNLLLGFVTNPEFEVSKTIISLAINSVVTAGLLPLGSIAFTLLYYDIIYRKGLLTKDNV